MYYEMKLILYIVVNTRGNGTKTNRGRIYNNNHKRKNINNNTTLRGRRIKMFFARERNVIHLTPPPPRPYPPPPYYIVIIIIQFERLTARKKKINDISLCCPYTNRRVQILCSNCQTYDGGRRDWKFACPHIVMIVIILQRSRCLIRYYFGSNSSCLLLDFNVITDNVIIYLWSQQNN